MGAKRTFFLIMIPILILGCNKENDNDSNLLAVDLLTKDDPAFFAKTVILYEDDNYLIKTNFAKYIGTYPFKVQYGYGEEPIPLGGYEEIEIQVTQASNNQDILLMTDYLDRPNDSTYILAHHLEGGSCLIFDKKASRIISTIEMEEYMEGGPMTSTGGRRFYIKGVLFIETVDFIS